MPSTINEIVMIPAPVTMAKYIHFFSFAASTESLFTSMSRGNITYMTITNIPNDSITPISVIINVGPLSSPVSMFMMVVADTINADIDIMAVYMPSIILSDSMLRW